MEKLIEKKITVLIPKSKEIEFNRIIKEFEDIYLEAFRLEIENGGYAGLILKKKLFLNLASSKISIFNIK